MSEQRCPRCDGSRLEPYPGATILGGKRIQDLTQLTIRECAQFFDKLKLPDEEQVIADELLKEIRQRLQFLLDVGLDYLTLERTSPTLSGGEAQRVRLASQIGCGLVGVTYILDEPSIGLHPRDNKRLIHTLQQLRDKGNTVIVVEHDEETLRAADRIIDFGPGAGSRGGEVVFDGSVKQLLRSKRSVTGGYLSGRLKIPVPEKRRKKAGGALKVKGATHHNLKKINVEVPLGQFVAVTGVSGSGKSSLVSDILAPALINALHRGEQEVGAHGKIEGIDQLDKAVVIDQSPIGRNPRSNPSTYIKLWDEIRDLFTKLPESQARGYKPGRFSFNVREGSCHHCSGMGQVKVDMDFLETAWVECPLCDGRRFDQETLSVLFKGKSIFDILDMEVSRALDFFDAIPSIKGKLETLHKVGLDYMKLGQPSTTLSGGEAQRIKLAKELVRPATGKTLYILDEPTTGLHFHDINALLKVLHALVERGNSVVVIEHNMEVVKNADWILDLGPEGGAGGGELVASGTPEAIAKLDSPTGRAVHEALYPDWEITPNREKTGGIVEAIEVEGAQEHNLKHLDVRIPRGKMTVCTGPSGSGKTSLAFDTIYAEGQRRYIESLSPYARQFVKQMPKPQVGRIEGLSPAVAIEQKAHAGNPRSTVGTLTEIYDFLRVLYARKGIPQCPETGEPIKAISKEHVVERILHYPEGERLHLLAPLTLTKSDNFEELTARFLRQGYLRLRLNGEIHSLEEPIPFDRKRKNKVELVVDRVKVSPSLKQRLYEAVEHATSISGGTLRVLREEGEEVFFNLDFCVESTGKSYPEITPQSFAFNTAHGMCPECTGLGVQYGLDLTAHEVLWDTPLCHLLDWILDVDGYDVATTQLRPYGISPFDTMEALPPKKRQIVLNGAKEPVKVKGSLHLRWIGLNPCLSRMAKLGSSEVREAVLPLLNETPCPSCKGSRLNPLAAAVTLNKVPLGELCSWPVERALPFLSKVRLNKEEEKVLGEVATQLKNRLSFLAEVGLHYLSLDRKAPTLSGGETQRIRLARQLGSSLTGVLYVLDEPTIGLHPHDNHKLLSALDKLKQLGNTLLLVEHDPETIRQADYLLDFGPASGAHGGHITARGTPKEIMRNKESLTGRYLSGKERIPLPEKRERKEFFSLQSGTVHNLKDFMIRIPEGVLTCLTGVSGSGKSTLLHQVIEKKLPEYFDRTIIIDQNPIGTTRRASVATYSDAYTPLRHFFGALPEAQVRGLMPVNFSYNHRKGMCTHCWGMGYKRVEMHFLPAVKITCPECKGYRLNPLALEVKYKGKNLGEHLKSTVAEALHTFGHIPKVKRILDTLVAVGLEYLPLGQPMQTLSGGEAQRIKLSTELQKRSRGRALYLLDEPTTGLHTDDIKKLMKVLHTLVDKGHTMLIIEHNLEVIQQADWIIDLGPEAGEKGGELVAMGSPDEVMEVKGSHTGRYLKEMACLSC